ncbi:hypothetical protein ACOSQ4_015076 [Xanthoceras sorbifolium]
MWRLWNNRNAALYLLQPRTSVDLLDWSADFLAEFINTFSACGYTSTVVSSSRPAVPPIVGCYIMMAMMNCIDKLLSHTKPGNKKLSIAANLANLLPIGTTLVFQAFMPSFTNNGSCLRAHKSLTSSTIICFSVICFFSSFTNSFIAASNGKLYYGLATPNGLHIFNKDEDNDDDNNNNTNEGEKVNRDQQQRNVDIKKRGEGHHQKKLKINFKDGLDEEEKKILAKYRIRWTDFLHAFGSLLVFVVYVISSYDTEAPKK